ncbi:hypothetical protein V3C99_001456 [Haemonchus contortus]
MASVSRFLHVTRRGVTRMSQRNSSSVGWICKSRNYDSFRQSLTEPPRRAESSRRKYKNIFVFVSIPCLAIAMYAAYIDYIARKERDRPKYIPYAYLNVRKRPFPWGDGNHSLFHNPREQYVPGVGFEEDYKK